MECSDGWGVACNNDGMKGQEIKRVEYRFTLTPVRDEKNLLKSLRELKSKAKLIEKSGKIPNLVSANVYLDEAIGITFVVTVDVDSWDTAGVQSDVVVKDLISRMGIEVIDEDDPQNLPEADTVLNVLGSMLAPA